jgi:hydrogenase maturation protease
MPLLDAPLTGEPHSRPAEADLFARVLVLGVGNVLMGDEGIGVHAIRQLEKEPSIPGVRLLDGGTGGVNLLAEFDFVRALILLDATRDGRADGTLTYLQPKRVSELPRGLGAHDFGLKDLFAASALIGRLPQLHVYTLSVTTIRPMCLELSSAVAAALPTLVRTVHQNAEYLAGEFAPASGSPQQRKPCAHIANRCAASRPMIR